MNVKELIEKLSEFPEDMEVHRFDHDDIDDLVFPIKQVKQKVIVLYPADRNYSSCGELLDNVEEYRKRHEMTEPITDKIITVIYIE